MGLTIHYDLKADPTWGPKVIRRKLEAARQYAQTLPVLKISELGEFCGSECDFEAGDPDNDTEDPFHWCKIQAGRYIASPWEPGCSRHQAPSRLWAVRVWPAEGCEEMNFGVCHFSATTWKPRKPREDAYHAWSLVFDNRASTETTAILRQFLRKWRFVKKASRTAYRHTLRTLWRQDGASVQLVSGRYLSHRQGRDKPHVELTLPDSLERHLDFRYRGEAEAGIELAKNEEFRRDVRGLLRGKPHRIPGERGTWSSFCKTQYANNPDLGGWENFCRAHLSVVAVLDRLKKLGFRVRVSDEGGFWKTRDLAVLAKNIGDYDRMIAGLAGVFKDSAEQSGAEFDSAMLGRRDFEKLEAESYKVPKVGEFLQKLRDATPAITGE